MAHLKRGVTIFAEIGADAGEMQPEDLEAGRVARRSRIREFNMLWPPCSTCDRSTFGVSFSHKPTNSGCMVSSTTRSSSPVSRSRSVSSRTVAPKAASTLAASYLRR